MSPEPDIETAFLDFCLTDQDQQKHSAAADRVLSHPEARRFLCTRARDPQVRPTVFQLARHDVQNLAGTGVNWTTQAAQWLVDLEADWAESAEFCAKVCRRALSLRNSARPWLDVDRILRGDLDSVAGRAWLHIYLCALRHEFRYPALEHAVETLTVPMETLDPYVHALYAAALLVQDKPEAELELQAVIERGADDRSVLHVLTDALRFAETVPNRGEIMLDLLRRPAFAGHRDGTILRREAIALRLLGRYDEAIAAIDRSLMLLQPNEADRYSRRVADRLRVVEERNLIDRIRKEAATAQERGRLEIEQASREGIAQVEGEVADLRRQMADNLFRIVEILGIFTALIALVIGTAASVAVEALRWWERGVLMAVFGVVSIGFFVALRFVIHTSRGR